MCNIGVSNLILDHVTWHLNVINILKKKFSLSYVVDIYVKIWAKTYVFPHLTLHNIGHVIGNVVKGPYLRT